MAFLGGKMYFICGIHGVGKTTFAKKLSEEIGVRCYSTGELIKKGQRFVSSHNKMVSSIDGNQKQILNAIQMIPDSQFVLDGHLCLINSEGGVQRIDKNVFQQWKIDGLYIVIDKNTNIYKRIKKRNHKIWDIQFIEEFQRQEIEYACELSKLLQVPLKIIYNKKEIKSFAIIYDHNILLPIKPVYANKILEQTKKYEYRRKICKKDIGKIYIYATSPVKRIVGEAEVIDRMVMEKEKLWNITKKESGISLEFFNHYFNGQDCACAYHLGKVKRYKTPLKMEEIGIDYSPQSFVYIGDL